MKFVIFHGSFGSPDSNWFPELKEKLQSLKQQVLIPKFPTPQKQNLDSWFKVFDSLDLSRDEPICFIGHSLGCLFILHIVNKYNINLDCAIFVSPFMRQLDQPQFDQVNASFYKTDFNFQKLKKLIPTSYVLYSDNDPYVAKHHSIGFAKRLNSSLLFVKRAGHMNKEVNLNEFPLVFELCKTRLDLSLYQKYMAHRKELYAVDYIDPKSEEVLYLEPEEVFDEGVFKFRNLRQSGFCTFLTSVRFWDTQSAYYQQARLAAKRIKEFTRVFVVANKSDLQRPKLREHIKLDLEAGIKVYLCPLSQVEKITPEPDFGIWDNDYLCIVKFSHNEPTEVELSSRKKDIQKALIWKRKILQVAIKINNSDQDIDTFIDKS